MARVSTLMVLACTAALDLGLTACGSSGVSSPGPSPSPSAYAGAYYPLYNSGVNQWIEPTDAMPFDKVSVIFAAFAHAYRRGSGAALLFEAPNEPARLHRLMETARKKNPHVKVLISLGWGHDDWTYISNDYVHKADLFVPSVIQLVRSNDLDGFDIDDEDIGSSSGEISQSAFDGVIASLRSALNAASSQDNKPYYLDITPAGNNDDTGGLASTQVDAQNARSFDLINIQSYFRQTWGDDFVAALQSINYPAKQTAPGINTEGCAPEFPKYAGFAGMFDWNMSADSACHFKYTLEIAQDVGY